ncbi:MAG TPA: carboxypeptidase regulatory-like domain-containing protein [Pyrinomonadaceae bacterium]|nr:carboxypeptidase regulatory-like domain-containing protein [Pyrinomonadaceae bacterium]
MFSKNTASLLALTILIALIGLGSACGDKGTTNGPNTNTGGPSAKFSPKGNEGSIAGVVAFEGTAPAPKKVDTTADAACGSKNPNLETEDNMVKDGKLANAFVYIKEGTLADGTKITGLTFDTPSAPVNLDQNGCHYVPHVSGAMVNQKLNITNSDPTQHNIHFTPKNNDDWNQSQPNGAAPLTHEFKRAEVLVPVKCNQHPWMKAYVGVLKHPFFAVSKADGTYEIKGVPPGTYTLAAWHEGPGNGTEKTVQVTVAASAAAKGDFSFSAATAGNAPSLEMLPALEVPVVVAAPRH